MERRKIVLVDGGKLEVLPCRCWPVAHWPDAETLCQVEDLDRQKKRTSEAARKLKTYRASN